MMAKILNCEICELYIESTANVCVQILHDGSKELAQNETDPSKYVISSEIKVWIHHFNVYYSASSDILLLICLAIIL